MSPRCLFLRSLGFHKRGGGERENLDLSTSTGRKKEKEKGREKRREDFSQTKEKNREAEMSYREAGVAPTLKK